MGEAACGGMQHREVVFPILQDPEEPLEAGAQVLRLPGQGHGKGEVPSAHVARL
mgnify:CR=1 FL=1